MLDIYTDDTTINSCHITKSDKFDKIQLAVDMEKSFSLLLTGASDNINA